MIPPPVSPVAMDKVETIQRSLRCFTLGLIGVLPVVGIPFGVMALADYFTVKRAVGAHWNPAQKYLTWGGATALAGILLTTILTFIVAAVIVLELT